MSYVEGKVFGALKGMGAMKASSVDGFLALFFQKYWHIVGSEVSSFCLGVLNENNNLGEMNATNIILIPKIQNPTNVVNFRLVCLCNVIYKIIAKMIANRFQKVLNDSIDSS